MQVKKIMSSEVTTVGPELTIQECAEKMRDLGVGSLPVLNAGEPVGMITDRDICCRAVADGVDTATTKVQEVMTKEIACCYDDQECAEAANLMEEKHIRRLAVRNREEAIVGFLSVDDLARCSHDLAGEVLEAAGPSWH